MFNFKIRNFMQEHNIRQYQLAKLLGVSEATVSKKLNGKLSDEYTATIMDVLEEYISKHTTTIEEASERSGMTIEAVELLVNAFSLDILADEIVLIDYAELIETAEKIGLCHE